MRIDLSQDFIDSISEPRFRKALETAKGKECIIGIEKHYDLYIGADELRSNKTIIPLIGTISYECQGREYKEDFSLDVAQYMTFFSSTTDEENMLNTIKAIEKDLKSMKDVMTATYERSEGSEDG